MQQLKQIIFQNLLNDLVFLARKYIPILVCWNPGQSMGGGGGHMLSLLMDYSKLILYTWIALGESMH